MATIDTHNNERLRKPMLVEINITVPSEAEIQNFEVMSSYKLYDNLGGISSKLRVLADLQGGGFMLDGTAELYDPSIGPGTFDSKKYGLRGNVGQPVTVRVIATENIDSLTVTVKNVSRILREGGFSVAPETISPVLETQVIEGKGPWSTLTFYPTSSLSRVIIDTIVTGADFRIRNNNLVSAQLELRSCFDDIDPKWEESTLDVSWMNSADIGGFLNMVPEDVPVMYRAGYHDTGDSSYFSDFRYFYVDGQVTQSEGVVSLKARDASHWLDGVTVPEGNLTTWPNNRPQNIPNSVTLGDFYDSLISALRAAGAGGRRGIEARTLPSNYRELTTSTPVIKRETSFKNSLAQMMACGSLNGLLWLNYIDAGRPYLTFQQSDIPTRTVRRSQISDFDREVAPKVREVSTENVYGFDALLTPGARRDFEYPGSSDIEIGTIYEVQTEMMFQYIYSSVGNYTSEDINWRPFHPVFKAKDTGIQKDYGTPLIPSGAVYSYQLGSEGVALVIDEPLIIGKVNFTGSGSFNPFRIQSRNNEYNKRHNFTWKGDPRWQPRDKIELDLENGYKLYGWIENISMRHEGGGTIAEITIVERDTRLA